MHEGVAVVVEEDVAEPPGELVRHAPEAVDVEKIGIARADVAVVVRDARGLGTAEVAADGRLDDQRAGTRRP
jgi:hypothetical protein